ncbi:MAG: glycosyltransferase [Lachnospiraceae bacterium]|nr:glycosyltransferase [Lachnospiraceae bacterium]
MRFSIIVVALNAGEKLKETVQSVLAQDFTDYEIIVKDGGSRDGSVEKIPEDPRIRVYRKGDKGIYDAMNQAVEEANGQYILFLNCGDHLYDRTVLRKVEAVIAAQEASVSGDGQGKDKRPLVVYGDVYSAKNQVVIAAPKHIDGGICYRNIPCHQACYYAAELCKKRPYDQEYRIRADYDHFLWCYYEAKARMIYSGDIVASYEGGGYSESKANRKRDKAEHKMITEHYMSRKELRKYRLWMAATLAPLRKVVAENRLTAGLYYGLRGLVQKKG